MEYRISKQEISRRKKAYLTLCLSLLSGLLLSSIILNFPIYPVGYLSVFTALFLLGAFSFSFLRNLSQITIILTNQLLIRQTMKNSEEYLLKDINRVKIKWTTNKTIREIYIWLKNGKSIFLSALADSEQFEKDLLGKLNKNVVLEKIHEPLDFDHPLFYSLLGFPISGVGLLSIKTISNLNYQHTKTTLVVFIIYLLILGSYFVLAKPLSKRYDIKKINSDYTIGIFMIASAVVILLLFFR
jgi:hypothetical protein